ncbi:DUF4249 domain-containing protein [Spongiivirga citrea]|uniref:DUF4249 family protein n=1 Tax=Spongiivirga citrea TaxID=1481457 RepID=A0A6M0CR05_9FLAO|nr:DUF4249 domain-containing protein [Spongiivirga citrea]NER16370.1 DUF4249 family protein [Spongiivirga citrea]
MNKKNCVIILVLSITSFLNNACLETFEPGTETFEDILVVQATLTNEMKQQEVILTRSFRFEDDMPNFESQATVTVSASNGNTYSFSEVLPGTYTSDIAFAAQANTEYQLNIQTTDGSSYNSRPVTLPAVSKIDAIRPQRTTNSNGVEGMALLVDSFDPTGSSQYYRYEFEETYKIIAPSWTPLDLEVASFEPPAVNFVVREKEERICYGTGKESSIILESTVDRAEDRIEGFPVRFISSDNFIISHRYSILVKQYVHSINAFTFYETLRDLLQSESLFSDNQPGFINGNITSIAGEDEKVAGFFDIASVDKKRVFFNYVDFYPGEAIPPYATACVTFAPELIDPGLGTPLLDAIVDGNVRYFSENKNPGPDEGPYLMVSRICGDCTVLGSNIVPDFWEE